MPQHINNADQYRLPFGAAEAAAANAKAVLQAKLDAVDPRVAGVSVAKWEGVARLLEAWHFYAGRDPERYAQPDREEFEANVDMSHPTISKHRSVARALGLIRTERPRVRRGEKRPSDKVWINHAALDRLVAQSRDARREQSVNQTDTREHRGTHIKETPLPPNHQSTCPPPPPGVTPAASRTSARLAGWGEVLEMLEAEGVGLAQTVCDEARSAGCTAEEVAEVVKHYRAAKRPAPPAWGPGALALRVRRQRPGMAACENWPAPCETHQRAAADAARLERRGQEARRDAKRRREREAQAVAAADGRGRLDAYRRRVAALDPEELAEVIERLDSFPRRYARRDPFGLVGILAIIEHLEGVTA